MIVKRVAVVLSTLVVVLFGRAAAPAAANQRTLVVDDDRQQCPGADYTSINAAILAAAPGDKIRVCPGLYNETVVVSKAGLSLQGSTNGSAPESCRSEEHTSELQS